MPSRSALTVGAALLAVGLPSVAHAGGFPSMLHTTVDAMSANFSGQFESTTSYAFNGPSTAYLQGDNYTHAYAASVSVGAFHSNPFDVLACNFNVGNGAGLASSSLSTATLSWTVTFAAGMRVGEITSELLGTWTVNSAALSVGDLFAAGSYTFVWTLAGPESVDWDTTYGLAIAFERSGGAVPLPGAAGLAAVGLVGLARRRRR